MSEKRPKTMQSSEVSGKKKASKRSWRKVIINKEEIENLEEDGLISIEELTDYSVLESQDFGPIAGEPSVKKKRKAIKDKDNNTILIAPRAETQAEVDRVNKKKKKRPKRKKNLKGEIEDRPKQALSTEGNSKGNTSGSCANAVLTDEANLNYNCDMSDWNGLGIPGPILASLSDKGFSKPTPIQAATLPVAIFHHQDIIGAAETGSGKTYAFALPILTHILDLKKLEVTNSSEAHENDPEKKPLYGLILTPTRELALQIKKHIEDITKNVPIRCAAIVGGLSEQKQERILNKFPEIIVATPGRLLDMINEGKSHLTNVKSVKFLVIDEVDRMLQLGHFKEVSEIMRHLSEGKIKRQTFLFSATLTLPHYHKKWSAKGSKGKDKESIQSLVDKVDISSKAKIIDLSNQHIAAEQIDQKRIICTEDEKDLYLFYVLHCYPGRTLVFVNSINCTRKICSFLSVLGKNPLQLHAGKQQRQRLKALDKFVSSDNSVLIATDVAARGLDVPNVDLVVHYHLPKDPRVYIHRSGRTARARKLGMSVILEGPQDFKEYKKIYEVMKLSQDLPSLDINSSLLPDIKKRVMLAKKIDKEEHKERKKNSENNWFKKAANSLDIQLDDSDAGDSDQENNRRKISSRIKALRKELENLLKLPLVPTGFSGNYITRTGSLRIIGE